MGVFSRRTESIEAWDSLLAPWQGALSLAWEAYRVGTSPVGAVVVDLVGAPIARGRDQVHDPSGAFHGLLAHAPIVALSELSPVDRHESTTLYTTNEPCAMCMGAVVSAAVGSVWFAARDPYAGAADLKVSNPHSARLNTRVRGPLDGPFGTLAAALRLELYLRVNPNGSLVTAYRRLAPDVTAIAEKLAGDNVLLKASRRRLTVSDMVDRVWPYLAA
jgi:tRNA(Arg) A34 adenosine deaminase TadA